MRETIESDTAELYFRQWPELDSAAVNRLYDLLTRLIASLEETSATGLTLSAVHCHHSCIRTGRDVMVY